MSTEERILRPDPKGRISLGIAVVKNISSYKASFNDDGTIVLEPQIEIPAREAWLYQNPEAIKKVRKGLEDAAQGKIKKRKSFSQYADDEIE
ncbi:MAG: hypothetical protein WCG23_10940 [bacterium]